VLFPLMNKPAAAIGSQALRLPDRIHGTTEELAVQDHVVGRPAVF